MSNVRTRVASSDWCASRIVVSVSSSGFCLSTHAQNFSGPSASRRVRVPGGGASASFGNFGTTGSGSVRALSTFPFTSGRPLRLTSPR